MFIWVYLKKSNLICLKPQFKKLKKGNVVYYKPM